MRAEFRFEADAISLGEHVHPQQVETFKVLSGELRIDIGEEEHTLVAGEGMTLPMGVPHYHGNVTGIETRVLYEIRPPMAQEDAFRLLSTLAKAGKLDNEGENMLAFAVFLNAHPDMFYLAQPSVSVQKLLFKLLSPIGRLRGYKGNYPTNE